MEKEIMTENKTDKKKGVLNVPNTLSLVRVIMVPLFVLAMVFLYDFKVWVGPAICAAIFLLTAFTDMLDGKIARKYNLITDFGKFIDPLADKFMVFGALLSILYVALISKEPEETAAFCIVFTFTALIVMFRELAVTSLRLVVAGKEGIVIAASWWGKVKTFSQCIAIVLLILNPIWAEYDMYITSYVACAVTLITTIGSGLDYFKAYLPYIDTNK